LYIIGMVGLGRGLAFETKLICIDVLNLGTLDIQYREPGTIMYGTWNYNVRNHYVNGTIMYGT